MTQTLVRFRWSLIILAFASAIAFQIASTLLFAALAGLTQALGTIAMRAHLAARSVDAPATIATSFIAAFTWAITAAAIVAAGAIGGFPMALGLVFVSAVAATIAQLAALIALVGKARG